jgi:RNA-binding protein 25
MTFQSKVLSKVNSVFAEPDEDEDAKRVVKKKLKPFEITVQDRMESMTAEEKKQMIKELIEAVPREKEILFEYEVAWAHMDDELVEQRIKPWIEKRIREYLEDDEPSLVRFVF